MEASAPVFNPKRIESARLRADMSHADLAYEVRRVTSGRLKPTEQSIRRWIGGRHVPREGVIAAIAVATGQSIEFFYELNPDDDDEDEALLRDLQHLPEDLRLRIEQRLARVSVAL